MRRDIFIGDIQGCWDCLERLLDKLRFDPTADRLCLAGDLVNRGGKSLKVLRKISALGEPHFTVLGNHDLHLLAYWHMYPRVRKRNAEFERILNHAGAGPVLNWLRRQPLLWSDDSARIVLVHAGLDPRWNREAAHACANEVEQALRGTGFEKLIDHMYGNRPNHWEPKQKHGTRLRTTTNVLTRMRFARADGRLDFDSSGGPSRAPRGYKPWFELLHPDWRDWTVVFGHWSMLGFHRRRNSAGDGEIICLDSGCVWGGALTAMVVEPDQRRFVQVDCD